MNAYLCTVTARRGNHDVEGSFHVVANDSGEALLLAMENVQREVVDRGWVPLSVAVLVELGVIEESPFEPLRGSGG